MKSTKYAAVGTDDEPEEKGFEVSKSNEDAEVGFEQNVSSGRVRVVYNFGESFEMMWLQKICLFVFVGVALSVAIFGGLFGMRKYVGRFDGSAGSGGRHHGKKHVRVSDPALLQAFSHRYVSPYADKERVKVCLDGKLDAPKMSLFLLNYLDNWGSELEFHLSDQLKTALEEYFVHIKTEDLSSRVFEGRCEPDWPVLGFQSKLDEVDFAAPLLVIGDEKCVCPARPGNNRLCAEDGVATFRHYYSSDFESTMQSDFWVPVGPSAVWKIATPDLVRPASERSILFHFLGSRTSQSRMDLNHIANGENWVAKYPIMKQGRVIVHKFAENDLELPFYVDRNLYQKDILDSVFVPCPTGKNPEASRIYEAMDAGAIPILALDKTYLATRCKNAYKPFLENNAPFVYVESWDELPAVLAKLSADKVGLDQRQKELGIWRATFWAEISRRVDCGVMQAFYQQKQEGGHRMLKSKKSSNGDEPSIPEQERFCGPRIPMEAPIADMPAERVGPYFTTKAKQVAERQGFKL